MQKLLLTFIFASYLYSVQGQKIIRDTIVNFSIISGTYAYYFPGGDIEERFGNVSCAGLNYQYKTSRNFLWTADVNYLFGENVKENPLSLIETSNGQIIDGNGEYATIAMSERGWLIRGSIGKIFPVFGPNPNCGLLISAGTGFLQHKIRIDNRENTAYQLEGDYKKGYDRLTNGVNFSQFVGYIHFDNKKLFNFYLGMDFNEALTKNRRSWDFQLEKKLDNNRLDLLLGFRAGIMIPLYSRAPEPYYFY